MFFFLSHGLLSDISTASDVSRGASGVKRQRNVQVFNFNVSVKGFPCHNTVVSLGFDDAIMRTPEV